MEKRLCEAKRADGKPCEKYARQGSKYCSFHKDQEHWYERPRAKSTLRACLNVGTVIGVVGVVIGVVGLLVVLVEKRARKEAEAKSALSGEFKPAEDPCSPHALRVLWAGNQLIVDRETGEGRLRIANLFDSVDIRYTEAVLVSGDVVSLDGRIVARIKDNEWELNRDNYFTRNYDESALEVLDKDSGVIILQIEFFDKGTVRLAGLFGKAEAYVCVLDDGQHPIGDRTNMKEVVAKTRDALRTLKPIFVYPSDLHLGERDPSRELPGLLGKEERLKEALQKRAGAYSRVTDDELVTSTLGLAQKMREFARNERARLMAIRKGQKPDTEEAAKKREQELREYSTRLVEEYERSFCIETILLRDELLRRQPQMSRDYMDYRSYEHANNVLVVESVAADLERLAKSLTRQE
jgi:hypothetical protein